MDPVLRLIGRYGSRGVLVDTNILLLHFIGQFDRSLVPHFKRTAQFTEEDFDLLMGLLARFKRIVTTPNVLSEVSNLSGQMGDPNRSACREQFARGIGVLEERYVKSVDAAQSTQFSRIGLTDSGIMLLAKGEYLVLTDDLTLAGFLQAAGVDVLNFNHIRWTQWTDQ